MCATVFSARMPRHGGETVSRLVLLGLECGLSGGCDFVSAQEHSLAEPGEQRDTEPVAERPRQL